MKTHTSELIPTDYNMYRTKRAVNNVLYNKYENSRGPNRKKPVNIFLLPLFTLFSTFTVNRIELLEFETKIEIPKLFTNIYLY